MSFVDSLPWAFYFLPSALTKTIKVVFICEDYLAEQSMNHKLVLTTELIFCFSFAKGTIAMLTSELAYKDLCRRVRFVLTARVYSPILMDVTKDKLGVNLDCIVWTCCSAACREALHNTFPTDATILCKCQLNPGQGLRGCFWWQHQRKHSVVWKKEI